MEEFLGEYIINIGKENLQVAVIRGKLKLDNVQLDGDLIGSHVLGAVGLNGFAVISCTAAHLRCSIPWSKLEKEPTKIELVGLQLVCVPLLPSNAISMHGAGTPKDPRCTLRTRVKRSAVDRFERNFFSWRIPGEGPPRPNMEQQDNSNNNNNQQRDSQSQSHQSQSQQKRRGRRKGSSGDSVFSSSKDDRLHGNNNEDIKDDVSVITANSSDEDGVGDNKEDENVNNSVDAWRIKFIQRLVRNIEVSIRDLHVRCEVGKGAFNAGPQQQKDQYHEEEEQEHHQRHQQQQNFKKKKRKHLSDESAFTFGFNIDSLVLQSSNSSWKTGKNVDFEEKKQSKKDTISVSGKENIVQDTKYKVFRIKNLSMYWDDSPPIIITECPLLKNQKKEDLHKIWSVIRIALDEMKQNQDPGERVRNVLLGKKNVNKKTSRPKSSDADQTNRDAGPSIEHSYVISPITLEVRLTLHNLGVPGPTDCQAELRPCKLSLNFNPKQMRQYRALQYALFAQKRLDTMLHQRPTKSPTEDPRAWWRYAISCVTTRPNARPWRDVKKIVRKRTRYIELIEKKHLQKDSGGLSTDEIADLLDLEDLLPIETLLAFHLLALRNVIDIRRIEKDKKTKRSGAQKKAPASSDASYHSVSPSRRRRRSTSRQRKSKQYDNGDEDNVPLTASKKSSSRKSRQSNDDHGDRLTPGSIDVISSFDGTESPRKSRQNKSYQTPTKSPLPKQPGRGRRSSKKNTAASPLSLYNNNAPSKSLDNDLSLTPSLDSVASLELDSIVNGIDSVARKMEFSLDDDDVSVSGFDKDEEEEEAFMQKTVRCHSLTIILTVMNKRNDRPIVKGDLKASVWIRQVPGEGITFLFDLKNLEFIDCGNEYSSKLVSFHVPDSQPKNDRFSSSGIMVPLSISNNTDDDIFLETFCNQMRDGELALPPKGVVSRLLVSERPNGRSISLSAHAATMVWNKICIDSFMGTFFPSQNLESRSVLQNQLRNAATPVAHKAQVALSSPKSLSINVNIDAPKVWFPVSKNKLDGALYVDVGKLTLCLKKPELLARMQWSMDCTGIQAKFRRSAIDVFQKHGRPNKSNVKNDRNDIPIVLPLNLNYAVERSGDGPATIKKQNGIEYKQCNVSKLRLSKICIKLVDVDVLASAIGKWYATELLQVKQKRGNDKFSSEDSTHTKRNHQTNEMIKINSIQERKELSITVEKVELYLQGQSTEQLMSLHKESKRTYLVEVANINLLRAQNGSIRTTISKIDYINIIQLKEFKSDSKRHIRQSLEPHHTILRCSKKYLSKYQNSESHENADIDLLSSSASYSSMRGSAETSTMRGSAETDMGFSAASYSPMRGSNVSESRRSRTNPKLVKQEAITIKFVHDEETSVDDMDVNFNSIETYVTTTTLRDCYGAIQRILESIKTITGEMERRVHEVSRTSRRDLQSQIMNLDTLNESVQSYHTEIVHTNIEETSLVLKVSLERIAILIAGDIDGKDSPPGSTPVIQMLSSALIMFQSVENCDASGSKTFHISLNDYSVAINSQFKPLPPSKLPPIIGPVAIDFRSVNDTENSGNVVSREISVTCGILKSCLLENDLRVMTEVIQQVVRQIRSFNSNPNCANGEGSIKQVRSSHSFQYQYKGSFIATTLKFQFEPFSFVLMRNAVNGDKIRPLFDLRGEAYGKLEGCATALYGESRIDMSIYFFSDNTSDWEYIIEPSTILLDFEQQPNDTVLNVAFTEEVKSNVTSDLIASLSQFSHKVTRNETDKEENSSTNVKKHENDGCNDVVSISNESGCDFLLFSMDVIETLGDDIYFEEDPSCIHLNHGENITLNSPNSDGFIMGSKAALIVAVESEKYIGQRKHILDLPIYSSEDLSSSKFPLIPKQNATKAHYSIEPIVEWCMQNQRLRSACSNISGVDKGNDLLSNSIWSPSNCALMQQNEKHWLHPYLDGDVHEWTDMTGVLKLERDRVMLPDNKWIWANDWTVDTSSGYGEYTDADGWEYATDFKAFGHIRRFYKEGDSCRRRRWTRTRLMKPPKLDDPLRPLAVVWSCSKDGDGNQIIKVTSTLRVHNFTQLDLTLFGYSHSWKSDELAGCVGAGEEFAIPLHLSGMTYIRLAVGNVNDNDDRDDISDALSTNEFSSSDYILITPSDYKSESIFRVSINPDYDKAVELNLPRTLNFTIKLVCKSGCTQIMINPILKVSNLLPCPLQFRLSEGAVDGIVETQNEEELFLEEQLLEVGMESSSLAVDATLNPLISFRVPGYRWSHKQRIVNRKCALLSWRPNVQDAKLQYKSSELDSNRDEYTSVIAFERLTYGGDPLIIVLEVVPGDCPLLRIFAQYWIIDKTGFGLRFCDGSQDLLGTTLRTESPRRSYLLYKEIQNEPFMEDSEVDGHEWSIGAEGVTSFFSRESKLAVCIDVGDINSPIPKQREIQSKWSQLVDISNVMPKAIFSVEEFQGERQFDLSYDVAFAPSIFCRTKIVTIYNRFHLVNLSENNFFVSQDKSIESTFVPPKSTVCFHWENKSLENKVRISVDNVNWTTGTVQLDKVGITAMRLPCDQSLPLVVQTEVRLTKNDHDAAVVVLIWYANDQTNPLYLLKNKSSYEICCRQSNEEFNTGGNLFNPPGCGDMASDNPAPCSPKTSNVFDLVSNGFNCGLVEAELGIPANDYFIWNIMNETTKYFGFDDPNKSHILEWTCESSLREGNSTREKVEIDTLGSSSVLTLPSGVKVGCAVRAERSTKVIEFFDISYGHNSEHPIFANLKGKIGHHKASLSSKRLTTEGSGSYEEEHVALTLTVEIPGIYLSIIDDSDTEQAGREIFLIHVDSTMFQIAHSRDGYDEMELRVLSLQIDNHLNRATHPVMFSCPHFEENEPFLHISAVRKLQDDYVTNVFRYAAFRMLAIDIALDRRTAEAISRMVKPFKTKEIIKLTNLMAHITETNEDVTQCTSIQDVASIMTSRRVYIEQLHLHPIRISFTFTQEWENSAIDSEKSMILQYVRKIPSLSNAELTFTSFVVSHAFESSDMLLRIIRAHYLSQLTKHFFSTIGSLAILNGPADFLANVGTGVRDFFYEPINGLVHGPDKFIEGLENGSLSLARGIFVGVVRGAANVTYVVNSNLANLTDEEFIDERNAYQRSITDNYSRGNQPRTMSDSLHIAGASIARGVKSGAIGLVDEPWQNFARHGPVGFVRGVGKALVGAIVKPVIGVGDGAVVVMNHMSEVTSNESTKVKIPKRLRRALPRKLAHKRNGVHLVPYDDKAAKTQKIVTGNETKDDAYLCHVNITSHLVIASDKCLWIINRTSREPWCLNWEEISHFGMVDGRIMQITIFSQTGLTPYTFEVDSVDASTGFFHLLSMQQSKMGNSACNGDGSHEITDISKMTSDIPGVSAVQASHIFGSVNKEEMPLNISSGDEIEVIENCFARVKYLGNELPNYFSSLDEESWALVSSWRYLFSGLNSRHCMVAGFINGTGVNIQIKSTKLVEGGSPCYQIPTRDYDETTGVLGPGAAIIFFAWGSPPSLKYEGQILMNIETNAFHCNLLNKKSVLSSLTSIEALPGYHCTLLERSITEWWAKYWVLVKCK